jgi:hypothetical protein
MAETRPSSGPSNNIFTVLAFISFVVLLIGVGYTWMRLAEVTGSWNPFG